jgi:hypothetical protein
MGGPRLPAQVTFPKCPRAVRNDKLHCLSHVALTNDLLYDSNDSRDIVKASFSFIRIRWVEEWVECGDLCQKLFFSVGEG